jgi:hypothetical protein
MIRPEPVREPLPPPKVYAPPESERAAARVKSQPGPPMTLGNAATTHIGVADLSGGILKTHRAKCNREIRDPR